MTTLARSLAALFAALFLAACSEGQPTIELPAPIADDGTPPQETPLPPGDTGTSQANPLPFTWSPDDTVRRQAGTLPSGPWPLDPVRDYSRDFSLGKPQSVALDEGLNLWLLDGDRIGVLRPGDAAPTWTQGVGQAREGFGPQALAMRSTVICGGAPGRAYVGYAALELQPTVPGRSHAWVPSSGEAHYTPERYAEYQKGDLDAVVLNPEGTTVLEEHLWRTLGLSNKDKQLGIHNTNDFHYDEDRSIRQCQRVTRGPMRGDVYVTTNHGVTRIQGLVYNSHRHPGWYLRVALPDGTVDEVLQVTDMYALGIGADGDVLVANEQMVGILVPSPSLEDWDRELTWAGPTPWRFKSFNQELGEEGTFAYWRAFEQVGPARYFLGSAYQGVWELNVTSRSSGTWRKLPGLPTNAITSLAATDDGALYIGTDGAGLWRLEADGITLARVPTVAGNLVRQLGYEPTVSPHMLLVLTDAGLTVLRGR